MAAKKAYIHLQDHHDPVWNKAFEDHIIAGDGSVIRPYGEREELQFDRWFDILGGTEAVCQLELTCDLKKYLELNPDRLDDMRRLSLDGRLEFLGGGAAVIDYSIVHGESIFRNFLYSFRWLRDTFDRYPEVADALDTFGLSAQLPQILRQFNLPWLPMYSRMFGYEVHGMEIDQIANQPVKPFWRGIDGSIVCVKRDFEEHGDKQELVFVNHQYNPCEPCRGQGCRFCSYTGIDRQVEHGAEAFEPAFRKLAAGPQQVGRYVCHTEETIKTSTFIGDTIALAARYGISVHFLRYGEIKSTWVKPLLDTLQRGEVTEDQIDVRREGNPIATGCYITRGKLKRENRELEHLLLAAEKFSAIAVRFGRTYPRRGIERLWGLMNVMQAHDAITGNHPDGPYLELRKFNRMVRSGAGKHLLGACATISENVAFDVSAGAVAATVFNPLNWTVSQAPTEVIIPAERIDCAGNRVVADWKMNAADGSAQQVLSWDRIAVKDTAMYRLRCLVHELPSCGYATFACIPEFAGQSAGTDAGIADGVVTEDAEAAGLQRIESTEITGRDETAALQRVAGNSIENDRYRIEYDSRGIRAIHDKVLNCIVAGNGSMDLWAEDDVGSLWERLKSFGQRINLAERAEMTVEAHTGPYSRLTIRGKLLEPIIWQLPPDWRKEIYLGSGRKMRDLTAAEALVCINSLDWTHEIYLHPASDRLDIRTSLNCDSENVRLHVPFDLGFGTCEDRAWYEIPYGMIERPSYRPMDGTHNNPDGVWPAVHWLAAVNEAKGYTCALLNRGIPAHRFIRGTMELHLHRSGRIGLWRAQTLQQNRTMNPLAKDGEMQVYEYAFVSGKGDVAANRLVHQGYEFNSVFPAIVARVRGGLSASVAGPGNSVLPSSHSFLSNSADNVIIPVIKRSEGDEGLVLRLTEVYGTAAIDTLSGIVAAVALTGPMEEAAGDAATEISFRPFEIITVRSKEA